MTYTNPTVLYIDDPIGVDAAIQSIQADLTTLPWLQISFGRAYPFTEPDSANPDRNVTVPKCFVGTDANKTGEWINVLYNDNLKSQSFIAAIGEETPTDVTDGFSHVSRDRRLAIVFWVDLKKIDDSKNYVYTEELKRDVERVLANNGYFKTLNSYVDERADAVFSGYTTANSEMLRYPFAGFRFEITVNYQLPC